MIDISYQTMQRIENIEQSIKRMDRLSELMIPLVKYLLPIRKERLINNLPIESIELSVNIWPKQFEGGVDRCLGFDIVWIE